MGLLKIGEAAKQAGVTIRTLHHYDAVGLLSPAYRSEAGYRLYTEEDLQRLTQIASLRALGLSLEEIRDCLATPEVHLKRVIRRHVRHMKDRISRQQELLHQMEAVIVQWDRNERVSVDEITRTLEAMAMFEKYYTPEQLEQLKKRGDLIGQERIKQVEEEWRELFASFAAEKAKGTDPNSKATQALAQRARGLIEEFTGGDAEIEKSMRTMYQQEGAPAILGQHGYSHDPSVYAYMTEAMNAMRDGGD